MTGAVNIMLSARDSGSFRPLGSFCHLFLFFFFFPFSLVALLPANHQRARRWLRFFPSKVRETARRTLFPFTSFSPPRISPFHTPLSPLSLLIVFNKEARDSPHRRNNFLKVVSPRSRLKLIATAIGIDVENSRAKTDAGCRFLCRWVLNGGVSAREKKMR